MRPWIAMRMLDIAFDETVIPFNDPAFKSKVAALSPAGQVPFLIDGDILVWDSLSILEYLADKFPEKQLWPKDKVARAHARSISAEMHTRYRDLRQACPMNLGRRYATRDRGAGVARDVARFSALVREARGRWGEASGERFLYGAFGAADAMYAPLVSRLDTYGITVDEITRAYAEAVLSTSAFIAWRDAALDEPWLYYGDEVDERATAELRPGITCWVGPETN